MKIKQDEKSPFFLLHLCSLSWMPSFNRAYEGTFVNAEVQFVVSAPESQTEYRRVDLELRYNNLITDIAGNIQLEEKRETINNQYQECKRKHYRCCKYEKIF